MNSSPSLKDHSACFSDCLVSYIKDNQTLSYDFSNLSQVGSLMSGPSFTSRGTKFFHFFNISLCGNEVSSVGVEGWVNQCGVHIDAWWDHAETVCITAVQMLSSVSCPQSDLECTRAYCHIQELTFWSSTRWLSLESQCMQFTSMFIPVKLGNLFSIYQRVCMR